MHDRTATKESKPDRAGAGGQGGSQSGRDDDVHSVTDILDRLRDMANDRDRVKLGEVIEALGNRSYGPLLLVPALIEISPVGGIPGLPTFLAAVIILFAVQIVIGRRHVWLPGFIARRGIKSEKVLRAVDKMSGLGERLDRWFHGRLRWITGGLWIRLAACFVIALALAVPPLELVPFASTAPMAAIAAFGLAMLVRDGLLMLIAFAGATAAAVFGGLVLIGG